MPASISPRVSRVFIITPIGARDTAPTPPNGTTSISFSQSATRMSSGTSTSTFAAANSARRRSTRSDFAPLSSPNLMNVTPPMCFTCPGATMKQNPPQRPPTHVLRAERVGEQIRRVDAVLERYHERVAAEQRLQSGRDVGNLPGLHAEQHRVDRSDVGGRRARYFRPDEHVAEDAVDSQAVRTDRVELRAARDDRNFVAHLGEPRAEVGAHAARAEYRYAHAQALLMFVAVVTRTAQSGSGTTRSERTRQCSP